MLQIELHSYVICCENDVFLLTFIVYRN